MGLSQTRILLTTKLLKHCQSIITSSLQFLDWILISGFRRDVDEICALWDTTRRRVLIVYGRFGITYRSPWICDRYVVPKGRLTSTTRRRVTSHKSADLLDWMLTENIQANPTRQTFAQDILHIPYIVYVRRNVVPSQPKVILKDYSNFYVFVVLCTAM